jgi:hypothetical protein
MVDFLFNISIAKVALSSVRLGLKAQADSQSIGYSELPLYRQQLLSHSRKSILNQQLQLRKIRSVDNSFL